MPEPLFLLSRTRRYNLPFSPCSFSPAGGSPERYFIDFEAGERKSGASNYDAIIELINCDSWE